FFHLYALTFIYVKDTVVTVPHSVVPAASRSWLEPHMSEATTMGLTAHSGHHRLLVIVAGGVAAFEGYDLASDGVTIPSVLGSDLEVTPQLAGYVGSLAA